FDNVLLKLDPQGELLWWVGIESSANNNSSIWDIEVDDAGFIDVGGSFSRDLTLHSPDGDTVQLPLNANGSVVDGALARYDPDGVIQWGAYVLNARPDKAAR